MRRAAAPLPSSRRGRRAPAAGVCGAGVCAGGAWAYDNNTSDALSNTAIPPRAATREDKKLESFIKGVWSVKSIGDLDRRTRVHRADFFHMRIALAQLNPTSGDINGNTAKILAALEAAAAAGADLVVTPEMALPGYCIGDLVEDAGSSPPTSGRCGRSRTPRAASPPSSGSSTSILRRATKAARSGSTTPPPSCAMAGPAARAQNAAAELSLFRRQAILRAGDRARAGRRSRSRGGTVRLGVSICEDLWDEFYAIKPLAELVAKGADVLLNINASPFCPGKRHARDEIIRRHLAQLQQATRLHQHHRRGGQRQEHHPVRRRKPRLRRGMAA